MIGGLEFAKQRVQSRKVFSFSARSESSPKTPSDSNSSGAMPSISPMKPKSDARSSFAVAAFPGRRLAAVSPPAAA